MRAFNSKKYGALREFVPIWIHNDDDESRYFDWTIDNFAELNGCDEEFIKMLKQAKVKFFKDIPKVEPITIKDGDRTITFR